MLSLLQLPPIFRTLGFHSRRSTALSSIRSEKQRWWMASFAGKLEMGTSPFYYVAAEDLRMGPQRSTGGATSSADLSLRPTRRFTLCQYPFLLSLGVKIHLLTFDGQRQMVSPLMSQSLSLGAKFLLLSSFTARESSRSVPFHRLSAYA
jgi:hypothetical protein